MTLQEYIESVKKRVDQFEAHWLDERKKAEKRKEEYQWPLEMNEAEWDEQFLFFFEPDRVD